MSLFVYFVFFVEQPHTGSSGHTEFIGLPLRLQQFTIMIEGRVNDTTTILTQRDIRLGKLIYIIHVRI